MRSTDAESKFDDYFSTINLHLLKILWFSFSFRGRGGYYNSYNRGPRPGGYRSGNPNYRPVRNHRNQNTVEGRPNQQASNGQQSQTMAAAVAAN